MSMSYRFKLRLAGLMAAIGLAAAGCTVNPATGERQFTAFLPPGQEAAIGAQEHPKIIEQFGGPIDDPLVFVGAGAGGLAVSLVAASYQAWTAARVHPAEALRQE